MLSDARPFGVPIHATAVAISGQGLVILGASGAGKSRLALALIAASKRHCPVRLIGDDRVLLVGQPDGVLMVRGHPRIQGFIERRGLGILAAPFLAAAPVRAVIAIGPKTPAIAGLENFPRLGLVIEDEDRAPVERVLDWWRGASTTQTRKRTPAA